MTATLNGSRKKYIEAHGSIHTAMYIVLFLTVSAS